MRSWGGDRMAVDAFGADAYSSSLGGLSGITTPDFGSTYGSSSASSYMRPSGYNDQAAAQGSYAGSDGGLMAFLSSTSGTDNFGSTSSETGTSGSAASGSDTSTSEALGTAALVGGGVLAAGGLAYGASKGLGGFKGFSGFGGFGGFGTKPGPGPGPGPAPASTTPGPTPASATPGHAPATATSGATQTAPEKPLTADQHHANLSDHAAAVKDQGFGSSGTSDKLNAAHAQLKKTIEGAAPKLSADQKVRADQYLEASKNHAAARADVEKELAAKAHLPPPVPRFDAKGDRINEPETHAEQRVATHAKQMNKHAVALGRIK